MKRTTVIVGLIFVVLGGVTLALWTTRGASTVKFETPYQAVLLDNNQVYYGKVQGLGTPFPLSHRRRAFSGCGSETRDAAGSKRRRFYITWLFKDKMLWADTPPGFMAATLQDASSPGTPSPDRGHRGWPTFPPPRSMERQQTASTPIPA